MFLLDERRLEPPEIISATGASLERLTGLPYGDDADVYRSVARDLETRIRRLLDELERDG